MNKIKKIFGFLAGLIFAAVAAGGIYTALVLLEIPGENQAGQWVVEEEREAITPLQSADLSDGREGMFPMMERLCGRRRFFMKASP